MYNIDESYKDTIIGHLGNSGTVYLVLQIVQCWRACAVDEDKRVLTMVLYCSGIVYKYIIVLVLPPSKTPGKEKIIIIKYSTIYHI